MVAEAMTGVSASQGMTKIDGHPQKMEEARKDSTQSLRGGVAC